VLGPFVDYFSQIATDYAVSRVCTTLQPSNPLLLWLGSRRRDDRAGGSGESAYLKTALQNAPRDWSEERPVRSSHRMFSVLPVPQRSGGSLVVETLTDILEILAHRLFL
jgi:hypothetical protein